MGTISKSFVLRKIQDGETVYLVRDITTEDGAGAALLQAYDPATGNLWLLVLLTTAFAPVVVRRKAESSGKKR